MADYVVASLQAWGIRQCFGVPGDTLVPFLDAVRLSGDMHFRVVRHEGAGAMAASAFAKLTGIPAMCCADAGPGSVQMLNGVYDAYMDRVPLVVVTGELPSDKMGTHWPQDADLQALYAGATVFNHTVRDPIQVPEILYRALHMARERRRPVRIGVPKNFWTLPVGEAPIRTPPEIPAAKTCHDPSALRDLAAELTAAARPVILIGQGVRGAAAGVIELAERLQAPLIHTMPAIGIVPDDHPLQMGVLGDFGTQAAADIVAQADVMLVLGSTWWQPKYVPEHVRILQVEYLPEHLGVVFPAARGVVAAAEGICRTLSELIEPRQRPDWEHAVGLARADWDHEVAAQPPGQAGAIHPMAVVTALSRVCAPDAVVTLDVGSNTFWFSRYFRAKHQHVLLSGHWRSMGFGLPAAIGAKIADPGRQVIALTGDGGLAMVVADLTTAVREGLAICIVLLSDGRYAEEEAEQERMGYPPFATRFDNPDWVQVAKAMGAKGYRVERPDELDHVLQTALHGLAFGETALVDVPVAAVNPMQPQALRAGGAPVRTS